MNNKQREAERWFIHAKDEFADADELRKRERSPKWPQEVENNVWRMLMNPTEDLVARRRKYLADLERAVAEIVDTLSALPEVKRISLFGSYARGRRDLFTDLDVLVIMESQEDFLTRLEKIYSLLDLPVDCDILCYTPEEFAVLSSSGFMQKILAEEIILYAAD